MNEMIKCGITAVKAAGKFIQSNQVSTVECKSDNSYCTNIDKESEKIIVDIIQNQFPEHGFLTEETGVINGKKNVTWIIDPIDGTHNFMAGINLYAISVGILEGEKLTGGIVYLPESNTLYYAYKGTGAFKNGSKIAVSDKNVLKKCSLSIDSGFRKFDNDKTDKLMRLARNVMNTRMFGSSVVNLVFLAEGKFDLLVEWDDYVWDYAGGIPIAKEAGAIVTHVDGTDFRFGSRDYFIANGSVHNQCIQLLNENL